MLVRMQPAQELVLQKLTRTGIFKTRSEAVRSAIMQLGKEYRVFTDASTLENELVARKMIAIDNKIKSGKKKVYSIEEVQKKYGFK